MQSVAVYEDKILEVCDEMGITPKVAVKGKQPGSRGKLTVKDIFGHDSEPDDDDDESRDNDDKSESEDESAAVAEPLKKKFRDVKTDDDHEDNGTSDEEEKKTPTKKRIAKSLGSFSIDLNINTR
jgi:hypothetical protein